MCNQSAYELNEPCRFHNNSHVGAYDTQSTRTHARVIVGSFYVPHRHLYIISEETSIFAPQRLRFYKALGVAAYTVGKVRASTVFTCVCSMFRPSDFFYYSSKTDSWWGCVAKVTASHLLMARPRHCLSAIHGWALPKQ